MPRTMPLASGGGGNNLDAASAAMLLSQSGPCSAQVFLMLPFCPELILEPAHFRVLLLRRLRLPLPFVPARCRCGREQDALGDHRSACPRAGTSGPSWRTICWTRWIADKLSAQNAEPRVPSPTGALWRGPFNERAARHIAHVMMHFAMPGFAQVHIRTSGFASNTSISTSNLFS